MKVMQLLQFQQSFQDSFQEVAVDDESLSFKAPSWNPSCD
jgi:hypothetical protein